MHTCGNRREVLDRCQSISISAIGWYLPSIWGFFVVLLVWASTRGASFQLDVHRHKRFKIDPFGAMFEVAVPHVGFAFRLTVVFWILVELTLVLLPSAVLTRLSWVKYVMEVGW